MDKLREIKVRYESLEMSPEEALLMIFRTYFITEAEMKLHKLSIKHHGYGAYQLYQRGEYLMESTETECIERAREIMDKRKNYESSRREV